jgi:hypothetical protein
MGRVYQLFNCQGSRMNPAKANLGMCNVPKFAGGKTSLEREIQSQNQSRNGKTVPQRTFESRIQSRNGKTKKKRTHHYPNYKVTALGRKDDAR